jgi:hypothetical protein
MSLKDTLHFQIITIVATGASVNYIFQARMMRSIFLKRNTILPNNLRSRFHLRAAQYSIGVREITAAHQITVVFFQVETIRLFYSQKGQSSVCN